MNVDLSKENRQIQQLWNAAKLYWEELPNERTKISKTDMNEPINALLKNMKIIERIITKPFSVIAVT